MSVASDTDNSGSPAGSNRSSPARYDRETLCFCIHSRLCVFAFTLSHWCIEVFGPCLFLPVKLSHVYVDDAES